MTEFVPVARSRDKDVQMRMQTNGRAELVSEHERDRIGSSDRDKAGQLTLDNAELLRRAVVGVVARQIHESDLPSRVDVDLVDDASKSRRFCNPASVM
jgi:hypothetical protein